MAVLPDARWPRALPARGAADVPRARVRRRRRRALLRPRLRSVRWAASLRVLCPPTAAAGRPTGAAAAAAAAAAAIRPAAAAAAAPVAQRGAATPHRSLEFVELGRRLSESPAPSVPPPPPLAPAPPFAWTVRGTGSYDQANNGMPACTAATERHAVRCCLDDNSGCISICAASDAGFVAGSSRQTVTGINPKSATYYEAARECAHHAAHLCSASEIIAVGGASSPCLNTAA